MYWFEYLILPNVLLNTLWIGVGLVFPSAANTAMWANIILLLFATIAVIYNFVLVAFFIHRAIISKRRHSDKRKTKLIISKRSLSFFQLLDLYLSLPLGFGCMFTALQLIDPTQFISPDMQPVSRKSMDTSGEICTAFVPDDWWCWVWKVYCQ